MEEELEDEEYVLPTLLELVEAFKNNHLDPEDSVFYYQSMHGEHMIHKDELAKEVLLSNVYSGQHQDRAIGVKTGPQ